jgi:hypothetical protein
MADKKAKKQKVKVKTEEPDEHETNSQMIRPSTEASTVSTESWPLLLKVLFALHRFKPLFFGWISHE